jgi:hypothetical protein
LSVLLNDALTGLVGKPTFVAMRPTGIMLCLSNQLSVLRMGKSGPYKWVPMFSDLVSTDWQVFSPEQMLEMRERARAVAAARAAQNQDQGGNE